MTYPFKLNMRKCSQFASNVNVIKFDFNHQTVRLLGQDKNG